MQNVPLMFALDQIIRANNLFVNILFIINLIMFWRRNFLPTICCDSLPRQVLWDWIEYTNQPGGTWPQDIDRGPSLGFFTTAVYRLHPPTPPMYSRCSLYYIFSCFVYKTQVFREQFCKKALSKSWCCQNRGDLKDANISRVHKSQYILKCD